MAEPFLAEIRIMSFNFPPKGWALCNGQLLPVNQNQALYSLLGTIYGGDGRVNFGLPDLRGRVPIHFGYSFLLGERRGEENHTLSISEMPQHSHAVSASSNNPDANTPAGNVWASNTGYSPYSSSGNEQMYGSALNSQGGSQPHLNLSPFLTLNFSIALQGLFPTRS